jgi:phosphoglycerate dehydrogenase-like enzyme
LSKLPNLKAIFSLGAGVDHVFADPDLPDVPIVRVVADDLTTRMSEYVVWQVLDHHRQGAALPGAAGRPDLVRGPRPESSERYHGRHHGPGRTWPRRGQEASGARLCGYRMVENRKTGETV